LQIKDQIFISHASEDKEEVIDPLVKCLSDNGITNYWYDKDFIYAGDLPIKQVNEGLSRSKVGIIVFSKHYLQKDWTTWELMVLLTLVITHKIRIIPFLSGDLTYEEVTNVFPILIPVRIEPLPSCNKIISIIKRKLQDASRVIENPMLGIASDVEEKSYESYTQGTIVNNNLDKSDDVKEVNQRKLSTIYYDLKNEDIPEVKEMAVTEIRNYSGKVNIWSFKEWWEIVEFLIFSNNEEDRMNGVYILIEALKRSKRVGENIYIKKTVNELFGHKLLEYISPSNSNRISGDSLDILEAILDSNQLFDIYIMGLTDGMEKIENDNEYTDYIRKFILRLEKGNRDQILMLLDQMRMLARSKDILVRKRALQIFEYFHKRL